MCLATQSLPLDTSLPLHHPLTLKFNKFLHFVSTVAYNASWTVMSSSLRLRRPVTVRKTIGTSWEVPSQCLYPDRLKSAMFLLVPHGAEEEARRVLGWHIRDRGRVLELLRQVNHSTETLKWEMCVIQSNFICLLPPSIHHVMVARPRHPSGHLQVSE